ncbi:MAG TPA: M50 family metallopeptidase [Chloroflexota bacterium]|nr:M50 family metallopeptidase [Chloroflexota bacterium]
MSMMAPPRPALVCRLGDIEFVARPAALALYGSIAAALDLTFLPAAFPGHPAYTYHLMALGVALSMVIATLLHEGGHALAYWLQGVRAIRITLRGSGGACAAVIDDDNPAHALIRAASGPAVTAVVVVLLTLAWHDRALPATVRLIAATQAVFSLFDLIFNALPVHPRCDGTFALRAALWLLRGKAPSETFVLYVWRPLILAAAVLALAWLGRVSGLLGDDTIMGVVAPGLALVLCAIPPVALAWPALYRLGARFPGGEGTPAHG